ncbi:MAG: hypothetical protein WC369_05020 [Dehalococcoidales bacterium]|jgi:hypothetical protein
MEKTDRIIFINSISEADDYLGRHGAKGGTGDGLFIGMSPAIRSYLDKAGLKVADTAGYFSTDSHIAALKKSEELVKWIEGNAVFADTVTGVRHAYLDFFVYWLRFAIHYCIWVIETAGNAIEAHSPKVICAYLIEKKPVSSLYIESAEGYFGLLIRDTAKVKGVLFEDLCAGGVGPAYLRGGDPASRGRSLVKFILQDIKFCMWELAVRLRNIFSGKKPVFFTTRFYNLDRLAKEFVKGHSAVRSEILRGPVIFVYGLPDAVIRAFGGRYSAKIISQKGNFRILEDMVSSENGVFSFKGVSFSNVVSGKIRDNLGGHIMGLMLWTVRLESFTGRSGASAFVSNGNRADDVILAELCANKGIPTVLVSHGSHVKPKSEPERIEWGEHGRALLRAPFAYLALQTPVAEGYLEAFRTGSRIIKTGPLIWGKQVGRKKPPGGKTIVHAGTPKPVNSLRPYVYETPDEYIRGICELAGAVENIPGAELIVRFRPSTDIGAADIRRLVPFSGKVRPGMEGPFSEALGAADLLVSFSSTTIEEALQNRIPVLLYGGNGRYKHIEAAEVGGHSPAARSAVYHVSRAEDLEHAVSAILGLGIDGQGRDSGLFDKYIYDDKEKESLADLLKI